MSGPQAGRPSGLTVTQSRRRDVTVLTLVGRLGIGGGDLELRSAFRERLAAGERAIVLELRGVETVDSAGLGEIVACHKRAGEVDARVVLVVQSTSRIHEFFQTAHLARVFEVFDELDEAVRALDAR